MEAKSFAIKTIEGWLVKTFIYEGGFSGRGAAASVHQIEIKDPDHKLDPDQLERCKNDA